MEYFPYGETWVKEGSESKSLPFKFTGKEEDPETGLYYYGARYYDAVVSRWCSVDPIIKQYLGGKRGGKGVYSPINLDLYHYAGNNPIKYYDPTGEDKVLENSAAKNAKVWYSKAYWAIKGFFYNFSFQ